MRKRLFCSVCMLVLALMSALADYYVSGTKGDDSNKGTSVRRPFATIQKAADVVLPGETVYILEGTYREEVIIKSSGTKGKPIVFTSYNDDKVVVTTTNMLTEWSKYKGDIYKTSLNSGVLGRNAMTVFVDGNWVHEAHWTDQGPKGDLLRRESYATYDDATKRTIIDKDLVGFPDNNWDGAFAWVQSHNWQITTHDIIDFDGTTGTFTFETPMLYTPVEGFEYVIVNCLSVLDAPGEWYFDEDENELYLWAPEGGSPEGYDVEVKQRLECFKLNGNDFITVENMHLQGGDLDMNKSNNITVRGCYIQIPDRNFGKETPSLLFDSLKKYDISSLVVSGNNNIIRDNEFDGTWTESINLIGGHNEIVNNYFHNTGYSNTHLGSCVHLNHCADANLISHNTFTDIGRGAIGGNGYRFVIQYNDFSRSALLTEDVGIIAFGTHAYFNSIVHHNVFHDIDAKYSTGMYVDNNGSDIIVHHNISYNIPATGMQFNLPASFILVYNNTCYESGLISAWTPGSNDASGCRFANNLCSDFSSPLERGGAFITANFESKSADNFTNVAEGDFTLSSTSGAIDAGIEIAGITDGFVGKAPDAGALEYGEKMWKYGHDFETPPAPTYEWQRYPYANSVGNPGFEESLAPWDIAAGSPKQIISNAWNYKEDALGITALGSLEMSSGDAVSQKVVGLRPNTTYKLMAKARLFRKDIQVEAYTNSSGCFTSGQYRGEKWIGGVKKGDWMSYDPIDFGSDTPYFNRIEIGNAEDIDLNVDIHLDSLNGVKVAEVHLEGGGCWFMGRADLPAIKGQHAIFLVFQDNFAEEGMIDRIRLLNTQLEKRIVLSVESFDAKNSKKSKAIGGPYWAKDRGLTFTTGADSKQAIVKFSNTNLQLNGYVDNVTFVETNDKESPYKEHHIPGLIQAEDFDNGGAGIAYDDVDMKNSGNVYRVNQGVDIVTHSNKEGAYSIAWTKNGEWLDYTIGAVESGIYDIEIRYSNESTKEASLLPFLDNKSLGKIDFEITASWDVYKVAKIKGVRLSSGQDNILNLNLKEGVNIDYIRFLKK